MNNLERRDSPVILSNYNKYLITFLNLLIMFLQRGRVVEMHVPVREVTRI